MIKKVFITLAILLIYSPIFAQFKLCGTVYFDREKKSDVLIELLDTDYQTTSDKDGNFCFQNLPSRLYLLQATYHDRSSNIIGVPLQKDEENIMVKIENSLLDEVIVEGKKDAVKRAEHSIKTGVINLEKISKTSTSVEQLLNRSVGVRVRNSTGLGGNADIVVGGFSGKSIKFLIDGIPIDYLGSSMGITKMPANMASFIEVYKGVMPTEIGIDALGAAVNIVTQTPVNTRHQISYGLGSFNTHTLTLNSYFKNTDKFGIGVNVFTNYSDNNFIVDNLPIADQTTGQTQYISTPLFHNKFKQYSGDIYFNWENLNWADQFKIKLNSYFIHRELQNDFASRSRPYGGVYRNENGYFIPSLEYKKDFLDTRLQTSQFIVYSDIDFDLADTVRNGYYDWEGNRHYAVSGSETGTDFSKLGEPILKTNVKNLTYRNLLSYKINRDQKLIFNLVENYLFRTADNVEEYNDKNRIHYNRFIAGLGYQLTFFDRKMESLSQAKFLSSRTGGNISESNKVQTINKSGWSFSQSLKLQSKNGWLVRTSIENAYRLPDQTEIFGDNTFIVPNLKLNPEQSLNFNLGAGYNKRGKYHVELNSYLRRIKDMIKLKEITQFTANFLNLDNVNGYGLELEGSYNPITDLTLSGNLTYNEFRFKGSNRGILDNSHFINARVSNMPYYFGNGDIRYNIPDPFTKNDNLNLFWSYSYVHQFYLDFIEKQYEPDGFLGLFGKSKVYTNRVIPIQQVHSAGFTWSVPIKQKQNLSVSSEVNNIFNKAIFNDFKMQSAGRSVSVKLTFDF